MSAQCAYYVEYGTCKLKLCYKQPNLYKMHWQFVCVLPMLLYYKPLWVLNDAPRHHLVNSGWSIKTSFYNHIIDIVVVVVVNLYYSDKCKLIQRYTIFTLAYTSSLTGLICHFKIWINSHTATHIHVHLYNYNTRKCIHTRCSLIPDAIYVVI